MLTDANGRPIQTEGQAEEAPKNGHNKEGKVDVRALPTGTLLYNLIRVTGEEVGLENLIMQMDFHKQQQKMVADPPELERAKEAYHQFARQRFIIANEINQRFAGIDEARRSALGIEIVVPKGDEIPTPEPAPEPPKEG